MPRNKVASELPSDNGKELAEITQWHKLSESALYNDFRYKTAPEGALPEEPAAEFFDELKPVIYYMKIFGLFPLQRRNTGTAGFKRCWLSLLYSIAFYIGMSVYAVFVSWERISVIRNAETQFDDLMFSLVHFLYNLPHFYLIPCHWVEVTKVAKYFKHWSEFQKQFLTVTGKSLYLGQRCNSLWSLIVTPFVCVVYISSEILLVRPKYNLWEVSFYFYILTVIFIHVAWWKLVCCSLRGAMKAYTKSFFQNSSIFEYERSAMIVAQYRSLWISISKLSRETGMFMCYTYGHLSLVAFTVMTLQLYGSLSGICHGNYLRYIGLGICVLLSALMVYITANSAHRAATEISSRFSEKLSRLCSSDKQVRRELKIFTQVMSLNSSIINLGGYVTLDRGYLIHFASTMVTYLIVLLQFRLGVLSLHPSNNTIANTSTNLMPRLLG